MIAGNLTTQEIQNYKDLIVLIPFGAFEQHGPYLPLLTDTYIAEEICKKVENKISEKVILFPAIWFGNSMEHTGFAGNISMDLYEMMKVLEKIFESLEKSGFKKGILFNGHGGNQSIADAICAEFSRKNNLKIKSLSAYTSKVDEKTIELFPEGPEPHAGSSETSILYALKPELRKAEGKIQGVVSYSGKKKFSMHMMNELSTTGILNSSETLDIDIEKGKALVEVMEEELIKNIEKLLVI